MKQQCDDEQSEDEKDVSDLMTPLIYWMAEQREGHGQQLICRVATKYFKLNY